MSLKEFFNLNKGTLRLKILASVVAMVVISLLGSVFSLYQITEVNRLLGSMNHVSIPLGKLFTQIQSDAEILHRELDRSLGYSHWKDPHWRPRPVPSWIQDVLLHEMNRVSELIRNESEWASPEMAHQWSVWEKQIFKKLESLNSQANQLYNALEAKDEALAHELYPAWVAAVNDWKKELQGSALEYEKHLRRNFDTTETRVAELRTNLELILVVVILMSLLMLWLGERALRPLGELTQLAREITRRGLRKEDKSLLPHVSLARSDEVSQLAREFHHMATALLEREKTVESQKKRLQEQNRLLRDMGELNQNILNSIDSILIVTDLDGKITKCNPVALKWLQASEDQLIGSNL
ncbi:HAMP domain-containing protein, partial [bacterium]|nr:HAMP domain-containing protein [bacterium]